MTHGDLLSDMIAEANLNTSPPARLFLSVIAATRPTVQRKDQTALSPVLLRSLAIQIIVILRASNITPKGNPIQMY